MKAIEPIISEKLETVFLALTLDTRKREEHLPVAVRINQNRRTIYYRTGLRCTIPDEWEKLLKATGKGANKGGELYKEKEKQLAIYRKVKTIVLKLQSKGNFTLEDLKTALTGNNKNTFSDVWNAIIKNKVDAKKIGTANSYIGAYNSFTKYIGENVAFSRIGVALIQKWEDKMKADKMSNTSIGIYLRTCRVIVNESLKKGYIREAQYPFGKDKDDKIVIQKGRKRTNEYIDIPTIKKIMDFVAPTEWSDPIKASKYEAINMWLFSYLGNGLNLADMALLTYNKHYFQSGETELQFIRKKTADTTDEDIEVIIPIIPEMREILSKYGTEPKENGIVFPQILNGEADEAKIKKIIAQQNSNIKDRLEVVCKYLKLPVNISMTWARHSFATNLTFAGVSERYISQAMGHTIKNVTGGYISLFPPEKRMNFNKFLLAE
jgi:integrase